jgi:hypothetical protein
MNILLHEYEYGKGIKINLFSASVIITVQVYTPFDLWIFSRGIIENEAISFDLQLKDAYF